MEPLTIKFDNPHQDANIFENFRQAIDRLKENLGLFKESAKLQAEIKRAQYDELVKAGFSKPDALMLVKDGFKP